MTRAPAARALAACALAACALAACALAACKGSAPKPGPSGELVLATASGCPTLLALDDRAVYFATASGELAKVAKTGGKVERLAGGLKAPAAIATDGARVLVATEGALLAVPKGGGAPVPLASGLGLVPTFAVDATDVYLVDYGKESTVARLPKDGGALDRLVTVPGFVGRLALDEASVYFVSSRELVRLPKRSGLRTAAGHAIEGDVLAADARAIYAQDGASFVRIEKATGRPLRLAELKGSPRPFVDERDLFWNEDDARVMAVPVSGGRPREIASGQAAPRAVAADASNVFWVSCGRDGGEGAVSKKPR